MYVCEECHEMDSEIIGCTIPLEFHDKFDEMAKFSLEKGAKRCAICGKWIDTLYFCSIYTDYIYMLITGNYSRCNKRTEG